MTPWVILPASLVGAMALLSVIGLIVHRNYVWRAEDTAPSEAASLGEGYVMRCLVALDTFANVLAGGLPGETISTRCGRYAARPGGHWLQKWINRWLNVIQPDHGAQAAAGDLARAQRIVRTETAFLAQLEQRTTPPG